MKENAKHKDFFLAILLLLAGSLTVFIFLPFLSWLVVALVLAVTFNPLNQWIAKKINRKKIPTTLCASLTVTIIVFTVVFPFAIVTNSIYNELQNIANFITADSNEEVILSTWNSSIEYMHSLLPSKVLSSFDLAGMVSQIIQKMIPRLTGIFSNLTKILIGLFVALFALYYFLKNGEQIKNYLFSLSPLNESDDQNLILKVHTAILSIFKGIILVSIIQGSLTGLGFAIFGVPGPFFWGFVATVAALIPVLGTGLVIAPGVLFLYFSGSIHMAAGLLLWGMIPVGLSDNVLRPILMAQSMQIHPFLVLLSVLGGISVFGVAGLIYGPIIMAGLFALIDIYKNS
jgi:predicted PurR-regulated permease PerM